ncbi:MAG: hypothetical protein HY880_00865 [Deltaproteobacteria bacterium]|nr:hypothetical protein [Deltaproteobacteria bacterium]
MNPPKANADYVHNWCLKWTGEYEVLIYGWYSDYYTCAGLVKANFEHTDDNWIRATVCKEHNMNWWSWGGRQRGGMADPELLQWL